MHPPAREKRITIRPAGVCLGSTEHNSVQAMAILEHLFGTTEEGGIEDLDKHPKLEMIALVRRCGQQEEIARMTLQRLAELVILRLPNLSARSVRG